MPVSVTSETHQVVRRRFFHHLATEGDVPFSVNFTALPMKFTRACSMRVLSPHTKSDQGLAQGFLRQAFGFETLANQRPSLVDEACQTEVFRSELNLCPSIFEKSRMSLMMASKCSPEV